MTVKPVVKFKKLNPLAMLPSYETAGAAGADVRACFDDPKRIEVLHGGGNRMLVPLGLACATPEGWEIQVRPRSGLALKKGVTVLNTPGTVDSDYRGPLGVVLVNHSHEPFVIKHGDRIAQFVLAQAYQGDFVPVKELDETVRGEGGFGSTGVA